MKIFSLVLMILMLCGCRNDLFKRIGKNKYELKKTITYESLSYDRNDFMTWNITFEKGGIITLK